jgi:uncharacterized protein
MSSHRSTVKLPPSPEGTVVWWKLPIMWLVLGGPAAVVVAGLVTAWIAFANADPQLRQLPSAREVAQSNARDRSAAPAQQVRNHVTTPSIPATQP